MVDLWSVFQAGAVGNGPGSDLGRKPAQNQQNTNLDLSSLLEVLFSFYDGLILLAKGLLIALVPVIVQSAAVQVWADLREDKIINPAPGFWTMFGSSRPAAGPGSSGNGPGPEFNYNSHSWALCVLGTDRKNKNMIPVRP